jgi:hypothetical protein
MAFALLTTNTVNIYLPTAQTQERDLKACHRLCDEVQHCDHTKEWGIQALEESYRTNLPSKPKLIPKRQVQRLGP